MVTRSHVIRAAMAAVAWLVLSTSAVLAHGGHEHAGDADGGSVWIGAVGVAVLGMLVISMVRRHDSAPDGDPAGEGNLVQTDSEP